MPISRRVLIYTMVEHTARRQIVHGIGAYVRERTTWQPLIPWADLERWARPEGMQVDGVIAYPHTREEMDFLLGLDLPVVCVGPFYSEAGLPWVTWDDGVAGRLAVTHLAEAGLRRIGFAGNDFDECYIRNRHEGVGSAAKDLALGFIREHAVEPIGVGDVLAAVPLSRRPLELRFKRGTGRTLQKEIWRVRLERAKEMLIGTNLSMADIALNRGFSEPQRMAEVFSRELGQAPGAFRKAHRHLAGHD